MDRRLIVALAVSVLVVVSAGCLGFGGGADTTTTTDATTTTEAPEETEAHAGSDGKTVSPPTETTTTEPQTPQYSGPKYSADLVRAGDGNVYDGEADFVLEVETSGSDGSYDYDIVAVRHEGGDFDVSSIGSVDAEPNAIVTKEITIDFRATGQYTVMLNGEQEAIVEVHSLRTGGYGDGGTGTATTTSTTTTTTTESGPGADVTGETNPGAE